MKQKDPNSLGLFVTVHPDCPFTQEQIEADVRGEFYRARINPTSDLDLCLIVSVHCLDSYTTSGVKTGCVISTDIRYGTGTNLLYAIPSYGKLIDSSMDFSFARNAIKDGVSNALTDYLKENFGAPRPQDEQKSR